jgi:hypothetical protein
VEFAPVQAAAPAPAPSLPKLLHVSLAQGSTVTAAAAAATRSLPPALLLDQSGAAGSSGGAAPGPSFGVTVVALLALFLLVAPRVGRRLRLDAVLVRPLAFVSLLERPG